MTEKMLATMYDNMFVLPEGVTILEKVLRPILVYFFLVVAIRLAGKSGNLCSSNPFDLVVLLILSNTVQNAIIGNDNTVWGGVVGATTLLLLNYGVNRLIYNNRQPGESRRGGAGHPLIEKGCINMKHIECERSSRCRILEAAARKQGFATLSEVDRARPRIGRCHHVQGKDAGHGSAAGTKNSWATSRSFAAKSPPSISCTPSWRRPKGRPLDCARTIGCGLGNGLRFPPMAT